MSKNKNKKKEKIIYYDDGSTIVDMSGVSRNKNKKQPQKSSYIDTPHKSTFKEKWRTYWSSVKMMFIPMLVVLAILAVLFLIMLAAGSGR